MNAIEFVREFGVDDAKEAITNVAWCETAYCIRLGHGCFKSASDCCIDIDDLKQIVEAFELVEKRGGLAEAKAIEQQYWNSGVGSAMIVSMELKQAIELVEKCNAN